MRKLKDLKFQTERQENIKCVNTFCELYHADPEIVCDGVIDAGGDPSYSECRNYLPDKLIEEVTK